MMKHLRFLLTALGIFAVLIAAGLLFNFTPLVRAGSTAMLGYGIGAVGWGAIQLFRGRTAS